MVFGKSEAGAKPQRRDRFRPGCVSLEDRVLLTVVDLANVTTAPYGVQLAGANSGGGAGWKVTDVGDINGSGYDSFVVTEPSVTLNNGQPVLRGGGGRAYLVFGSRDVNAGTINWALLNSNQRLGSLGTLGNTNQTNPLTGVPGFNFSGITFNTSQNTNSELGASVTALGDLTGNGFADFLIGAPGSTDAAGLNAGTGRAYLVYGGPTLNNVTAVDLDNPTAAGINVITFESTRFTNANIGSAVSPTGDFFGNLRNDIAIGAKNASINGGNSGAVFVINGAALATPATTVVLLDQVGQVGGVPGVIFTGATSGDGVGSSLAAAGSFDGSKNSAGAPLGDLLIGAPTGGTPSAYLVYGGTTLLTKPLPTLGVLNINLNRIGNPTQTGTDVAGVNFIGTSAGDLTGYAVSTAGDFNRDGLNDIMIGSPNFGGGAGRVDLIYGQPATSPVGRIVGTFQLGNLPALINSVTFVGSAGSLAGFSLSPLGAVNANPVNNLIIGAPGYNNDSGEVIVIPGNPSLSGTYSLDQGPVQAAPLQATVIVDSTPSPTNTGYFLGASVSGSLLPTARGFTIDGDRLADFVIGAPGLALTSSLSLAGSAFAIEGRYFPLAIPVSNAISTTIGINKPTGPFSLNLTASTTLKIYVFSNGTINPAFNPATDINPATIVVNGVPFPNATIARDPVDENGDGIPDAIITITPVSSLNLANGIQTITLTGRTLSTAPNANRVFTGSAQVTVSGAAGGGGGGGGLPAIFAVSPSFGFPVSGATAPLYGGRLVPSLNDLSPYLWTPLSLRRAYRQFLPNIYYRNRHEQIYHHYQKSHFANRYYSSYETRTLGQKVFDRGHYKHGFFPPKYVRNPLPHNGFIP